MSLDRNHFDASNCSVGRTLDVIGDRWTMLVIREAFYRVRRFDQMQRNLGIARNVLADRLQKLVANGILERQVYQERPQRFEYRLTQKGRDLYASLVSLLAWGDRYMADETGPPVVLTHAKCGGPAEPTLTCGTCGEPLDPREVRVEEGPGILRAAG